MNKFLKYVKVQSIRAARHYPFILIFTLILTASIILFAEYMFKTNEEEGNKKRIRVGLVGDLSETYLDIGITALTNLDSSKYYVELVELEESEAQAKLVAGELYGYIRIPEGFVESIVWGENIPLTYVAANSPATLGPTLVNEILQIISQLVIQGQNGIYGMLDIAEEYRISQNAYDKATIDLNVKYIDTVLDRENFYEHTYVGLGDGISYEQYYVCAFFILLLMLWGMTCASMLIKHDMTLQRVLQSGGHRLGGLVLGDYLPFAVVMCINTVLLVGAASDYFDVSSIELFGKMLPVVLLVSAMQFFLYEITSSYISGILLQLFVAVFLSYVSGFFYPIYSLPDIFQKVTGILPTGIAFDYLMSVMAERSDAQMLQRVWMYILVFLILSAIMRFYKMRSNKYD